MPVQPLKLNPGFDPNFWKPPPIIEPPSDILSTTKNEFCNGCQHFFTSLRPRWTDGYSLIRAVSENSQPAIATGSVETSTPDRKSAALKCFDVRSLRELCVNATNGKCHLCIMVYAKLAENPDFAPALRSLESQYASNAPHEERFVRLAPETFFRNRATIRVLVTKKDDDLVASAILNVLTDVQANTELIGRVTHNSATSSDMSIGYCKVWLQHCLACHTKCKLNMSGQNILPARLLDVSDLNNNGVVKLEETASATTPDTYSYLTLSHCWGLSDRLCLTQSNLEEFKIGVPMHRLALTFRQAAEITFRLGLRYLWIDSLCIIQDSPNDEDWLRESSKMASIYSRATCNIAASASSDSHGGCFRERSTEFSQLIRFEKYPFPRYEGQSDAGPVFIAKHPTIEALRSRQGPLDARGWIFQEEVLAPRTLYFSKDEILWECSHWTTSETWFTGIPSDALTYDRRISSKALLDQTKLHSNEDSAGFILGDKEILYRRWHDIVHLYTERELTRSSDKLPALSGIADIMKSLTHDDYLAGLWKQNLLEDLVWSIKHESRKNTRPTAYRAPSWSWASVDGTVVSGIHAKYDADMQCQIHNVEVEPLNQVAPTGAVRSGSLDITGLVRCVTWTFDPGSYYKMQVTDAASGGWLDKEIQMHPDVEDTSDIASTLYLFQLFRCFYKHKIGSPLGRHRLNGLILTPVFGHSNSRLYRRVGYFIAANWGFSKIPDQGWGHFVDGWTQERLTIV